MANRRYTSQFNYSMERMPVIAAGNFLQTDLGAFAAKVTQGITLTAVTMGSAGNSISIAFTAGATAGAEVVTVTGNAISVQIETGVSTVTQVRTAINASAAAAALVAAVGTSASTVATASALPLLSGDDTDFSVVNGQGNTSTSGATDLMTLSQIGTGLYKIALSDRFNALLSADIMLMRATAVDLKAQLVSIDMASNSIIFRMIAVATETNLANDDRLLISLRLRN